jgi:catechol-2,3-dioxygenase
MTRTTEPIIKPAKLAHIVLRTADKERLIDWWTTVFGMKLQHDAGMLAFLTYDDEHHRLAVVEMPAMHENKRTSVGLEHVAFTYDSFDDLMATYERLKGHGITPIAPINHGMTLSLYYADPDGNQVELQIDTATVDEANAFMHSDVFAANPIGVVFDPDDLVARRKAGESVESLVTYIPKS